MLWGTPLDAMSTSICRSLLVLLVATAATPAEAQLRTKLKAAIKQKAAARKDASETHIANEAANAADSAMGRVQSTVDSSASRLSRGTQALVGRTGKAKGPRLSPAAGNIRKALAGGPVPLDGLRFPPGKASLPADAPAVLLPVTEVLRVDAATLLVQGRADPSTATSKMSNLGMQRARAVRDWLVTAGVPAELLLVSAGGRAAAGEALVVLVRAQ